MQEVFELARRLARIRQVVEATDTLEEVADVLGIDPATLWRRRKKYGNPNEEA